MEFYDVILHVYHYYIILRGNEYGRFRNLLKVKY